MLRTVDEIRTQTEAAYEQNIALLIDEASKNKKGSIEVTAEELPDFLILKLKKYGYIVEWKKQGSYNVYWGLNA